MCLQTYIHHQGVAHRDIKPENVLLDCFGNAKLADFGLATVFRHRGKIRPLEKRCGTPPYTAPEVFVGRYQGNLVDIRSCGVLLVALVAGCKSPVFLRVVAATLRRRVLLALFVLLCARYCVACHTT